MLDRFTDPKDGARRVFEALVNSDLVRGDKDIAAALHQVLKLHGNAAGVKVIEQGASDNFMLLIFAGTVRVEINEREMARRKAGQHVGEMALIDTRAKRVGTVITCDECVFGTVNEGDFTVIANKHPVLWRTLAIELADRLRQRSGMVAARNERPLIFIGSTSEALKQAETLQAGLLARSGIDVKVWTDGLFKASHGTMESLEAAIPTADFAVLLLTPDDLVEIRGEKFPAPRDNIIFGLGLGMGALGRKRGLMVAPRGLKMRLPSDLDGLTRIGFDPAEDIRTRFDKACTEIFDCINSLGTK